MGLVKVSLYRVDVGVRENLSETVAKKANLVSQGVNPICTGGVLQEHPPPPPIRNSVI